MRRFVLAARAVAVWTVPAAGQQARALPFDDGWELTPEGAAIEAWGGRPALRLRTGGALRQDVTLKDGTIEFDLAMADHRSFVYLNFRLVGDSAGEAIYFRPHKSSLPDAVQYTPVWRGESHWQLYHGEWGTAPVRFARDQWMHVRLVLQGRRAALFVGEGETPAMVVPLAREPVAGPIGFQAFTPSGSAPGGEPVAAVANVVLRPGHVPYRFPPDTSPVLPAGVIQTWQLSPPFPVDSTPLERLPASSAHDRSAWPVFPAEPHGVLVIGRHLQRPEARAGTVARLVLRAERAGPQRLDLGFSDCVTVFLSGRPIFAGDARYSFDRPRQEGLIGLSQAAVWLPLERGDNEVLLAVTDGFGGWGLMARLDPAGGATVVSAASVERRSQ